MLYKAQLQPWIIPLAILVMASAYFLSMAASFPTFFNANSDSALFLIAAKYLRLGHPSPGYPLFTLMNAGWLYITPFWSDIWSLTILNAITSGAVAALLYILTRSILAPLLWLSAGLVVSQSTIVEQYSLMILFMLGSYYFYSKDKRSLAYAIASFGVMVNHQVALCSIIFLANDLYRHNSLKPFLWSFISLPLLLYIPLANRPPFLLIDGDSPKNYFDYFFGQKGIILGLAIVPPDNLVDRVWEISRLMVGGLGVSLILVTLAIKKVWKESFVLPLLFIVPLFYYFTMLNPWAYTYALPGIAFGAILACKYEWKFVKNVCIAGSLILLVMNFAWYDFGRTLDKEKTTVQFLDTLETLPTDAVVINHKAFTTTMWIMLHNLEHGTNITSLSWDMMSEYSKNNKNWTYSWEDNVFPEILSDAEAEGRLYEYSLVSLETQELELKKVTALDHEYRDFLVWLEAPYTSRLDCRLVGRDWTC